MKRTLLQFSRAAALAICAFAASQAQAVNLPSASMKVPFDFVVSGKTMPAGEYTIIHTNASGGPSTFILREARTRKGAYAVMSIRGGLVPASNGAHVSFTCNSGACYLRELSLPGRESYIGLMPRAAEDRQERLISLNFRR